MGNTNKSLGTLLEHLESGELIVPEIQREFVWSNKDVLYLFDSLYRSLPIGAMLIWKAKKTVPPKASIKKKKGIGLLLDKFYGYLLDGQQRLTAIQRVRYNDDNKYPLMFFLLPINIQDEAVDRFCFRTKRNKRNHLLIPVSDILFGNISPLNIISSIKDKIDITSDEENKILSSILKLQNILNYQIGIIEYEDDDYKKATELFIRFNSTGKKLRKSDLISSELSLQVPELVSSKIYPKTYEYEQFKFTLPFLIQCLAVVHKGKMKYESTSEIWDGSKESIIHKSWDKTGKGLDRTIEFLTGTVKWDSIQWLPSINALIPLIYLLSFRKFGKNDLILARKWLLLTGVHQYFSGSVYTELDSIIRKLAKSHEGTMQRLWNITKKDLPNLRPDDFHTNRRIGGVMSLYVSMLRDINAKDWFRPTKLDGSVVGHNAALQIHHFFPQALLRKKGYETDLINTFANYVIICKQTNLDISDKEPVVYLKEHKVKDKDLHDQCIPVNRELWQSKKYKQFLTERRKLLAERCNIFFR